VTMVSEKELLLKMSNITELLAEESIDIVVALDHGPEEIKNLKTNEIYEPHQFWYSNKKTLTKLSDDRWKFGDEIYTALMFRDNGKGLAVLGSCDNMSMLWENIYALPQIVFTKDDEDYKEEDEKEGEETKDNMMSD